LHAPWSALSLPSYCSEKGRICPPRNLTDETLSSPVYLFSFPNLACFQSGNQRAAGQRPAPLLDAAAGVPPSR
jgi:hypothetical protein